MPYGGFFAHLLLISGFNIDSIDAVMMPAYEINVSQSCVLLPLLCHSRVLPAVAFPFVSLRLSAL